MTLLVFKIILILLTIRVIWLIITNLLIAFWDKATEDYISINKLKEDPKSYVREDHICKFFYDMIWLYLFIKILIGVFSNQITIN